METRVFSILLLLKEEICSGVQQESSNKALWRWLWMSGWKNCISWTFCFLKTCNAVILTSRGLKSSPNPVQKWKSRWKWKNVHSHLVKFLISFSAHVLTIFLGFLLQYPWRNLGMARGKWNYFVKKRRKKRKVKSRSKVRNADSPEFSTHIFIPIFKHQNRSFINLYCSILAFCSAGVVYISLEKMQRNITKMYQYIDWYILFEKSIVLNLLYFN